MQLGCQFCNATHTIKGDALQHEAKALLAALDAQSGSRPASH
jgi:hypothetical protein